MHSGGVPTVMILHSSFSIVSTDEVNFLHIYTNMAVVDLFLMGFSTIVIVFTIVICYCTIVIVAKFDYHPVLLETLHQHVDHASASL